MTSGMFCSCFLYGPELNVHAPVMVDAFLVLGKVKLACMGVQDEVGYFSVAL